jgi:uncharacterized protein DUF664
LASASDRPGAHITDDRPQRPQTADERATLLGFLNYQRATVAAKCAGLTPEQLAVRAVPPSPMSLLGLLRHLGDVERGWFRWVVGGDTTSRPRYYDPDTNPDGDFTDAAGTREQVEQAYAYWHQEIAHAQTLVAAHALDDTFVHPRDGEILSLRWVLLHLLEEYARHAGHADLLRERLDGTTGE